MDVPLIAPSARKHGIADVDMTHAFSHPILVDELDDGFTMFVGGDPSGNLLEIDVIDSQDGPVHPRHASPTQLLEVTTMPRTAQEILDQADELAARFENYEPEPGDALDATALRDLRAAFAHRAEAEKALADAVGIDRGHGRHLR